MKIVHEETYLHPVRMIYIMNQNLNIHGSERNRDKNHP
jgi:hypothetical protein